MTTPSLLQQLPLTALTTATTTTIATTTPTLATLSTPTLATLSHLDGYHNNNLITVATEQSNNLPVNYNWSDLIVTTAATTTTTTSSSPSLPIYLNNTTTRSSSSITTNVSSSSLLIGQLQSDKSKSAEAKTRKNPYSIEELLKKPNKRRKHTCHYYGYDYNNGSNYDDGDDDVEVDDDRRDVTRSNLPKYLQDYVTMMNVRQPIGFIIDYECEGGHGYDVVVEDEEETGNVHDEDEDDVDDDDEDGDVDERNDVHEVKEKTKENTKTGEVMTATNERHSVVRDKLKMSTTETSKVSPRCHDNCNNNSNHDVEDERGEEGGVDEEDDDKSVVVVVVDGEDNDDEDIANVDDDDGYVDVVDVNQKMVK